MKNLLYITSILLLLSSCANNNKEASVSDVDFTEAEVIGNDNMKWKESSITAASDLAEAKLKDFFDLLLLEQKHPEFKEDIRSQILNFSETELNISDSLPIISIQYKGHNGTIIRYGDSLQKLKLYFNLTTQNGVQEDSITAVLRTQKVMVEQQEVTATKVTFEKE